MNKAGARQGWRRVFALLVAFILFVSAPPNQLAFAVSGETDVEVPLSELKIEEGVLVGISDNARDNEAYTKLVIPDMVTEINEGAAFSARHIKEIVIPWTVKKIGESAFGYCSSLEKVVIPGSVEEIGVTAFASCESLSSLTIFSGVKKIGSQAFSDCPNLTAVSIGPTSGQTWGTFVFAIIKDGPVEGHQVTVRTTEGSAAYTYAENDVCSEGLKFEPLPDNSEALFSCDGSVNSSDGLTVTGYYGRNADLVIPSTIGGVNVTAIGEDAFKGNADLKTVVLPSSVSSIGNGAFANCTSLTEVTVPNQSVLYGNGVFPGCNTVTLWGYIGSTTDAHVKGGTESGVVLKFENLEERHDHKLTVDAASQPWLSVTVDGSTFAEGDVGFQKTVTVNILQLEDNPVLEEAEYILDEIRVKSADGNETFSITKSIYVLLAMAQGSPQKTATEIPLQLLSFNFSMPAEDVTVEAVLKPTAKMEFPDAAGCAQPGEVGSTW